MTFPLRISLRRPRAADLGSNFDAARAWVRDLETAAGEARFDVVWEDVKTRALGQNRLPVAAMLPSLAVAVRLIARGNDAATLAGAARETIARFPTLDAWLVKRAPLVFEHVTGWPQILAALAWFNAHPRSGRYLRQVDVPGLDTKFFDTRRALFAELLDSLLPSDAIDTAAAGAAQFELRYGLLPKPSLVRFRVLDNGLALHGLLDLSVPTDDFSALDLPVERVFIIENEVTFLVFPSCPRAIAVFGAGYGVERPANAALLSRVDCTYWGDIDTHGFAILDGLRAGFPHATSMLMTPEVLTEYSAFWTREETPHVAELTRLTPRERAVYDDLRFNRLGIGVRLEQERIPMSRVEV